MILSVRWRRTMAGSREPLAPCRCTERLPWAAQSHRRAFRIKRGSGNKLGSYVYLTICALRQRAATRSRSKGPSGSDPDFVVYNGRQIASADGFGTTETSSVSLPAGENVLCTQRLQQLSGSNMLHRHHSMRRVFGAGVVGLAIFTHLSASADSAGARLAKGQNSPSPDEHSALESERLRDRCSIPLGSGSAGSRQGRSGGVDFRRHQ